MTTFSMFIKRASAYLVDICIVSLIITILSYIPFINPHRLEYSEKYNELMNLSQQYIESEISIEEYNQALEPISYQIHYYETNYVIIDIVCVLLYFGVLPFYFNGQTVGKKLFHIKIVSNDKEPLSIQSYILRSLVLNNTIISIIKIAIVLLMNQDNYFSWYENINLVGSILTYIIIFMILVRADGRGLHDFVGNTKVILTEKEMKDRFEQIEEEQQQIEKDLQKYYSKKKSTKKDLK